MKGSLNVNTKKERYLFILRRHIPILILFTKGIFKYDNFSVPFSTFYNFPYLRTEKILNKVNHISFFYQNIRTISFDKDKIIFF